MADMEIPEADAVEQAQQPDGLVDEETESPSVGPETPEADAVEQAQVVAPLQRRMAHPIRDDVPEADAWEQSHDVELDEDYRS